MENALSITHEEKDSIVESLGDALRYMANRANATDFDRILMRTYKKALDKHTVDDCNSSQEMALDEVVKMNEAIHRWATSPGLKHFEPSRIFFTSDQLQTIYEVILHNMKVSAGSFTAKGIKHSTPESAKNLRSIRTQVMSRRAMVTGTAIFGLHSLLHYIKTEQTLKPMRMEIDKQKEKGKTLEAQQELLSNKIIEGNFKEADLDSFRALLQNVQKDIRENNKKMEMAFQDYSQNSPNALMEMAKGGAGGTILAIILAFSASISMDRFALDQDRKNKKNTKEDKKNTKENKSIISDSFIKSDVEREALQRAMDLREQYAKDVSVMLKALTVQHHQREQKKHQSR